MKFEYGNTSVFKLTQNLVSNSQFANWSFLLSDYSSSLLFGNPLKKEIIQKERTLFIQNFITNEWIAFIRFSSHSTWRFTVSSEQTKTKWIDKPRMNFQVSDRFTETKWTLHLLWLNSIGIITWIHLRGIFKQGLYYFCAHFDLNWPFTILYWSSSVSHFTGNSFESKRKMGFVSGTIEHTKG